MVGKIIFLRDKINIGDALQFPNLGKKMKAFKEQIADEGRYSICQN